MTYGPQPHHGDPQGRPGQQPPWPQSWQQGPPLPGPPPGWHGQWPPPPPPAPPRRRLWPWIVGGVVLLLIVIGVANADPAPTGRAALPVGTIEMPNYVGVNARAATDELRNTLGAGLSVMATGGDASSGYAVAAQSPAPGTPINLSSQILFYTAAPTAGNGSTAAGGPPRAFTLTVGGSARRATVYYGVSGSSGGGDQVRVPWTKTVADTAPQFGYASVSANTDLGDTGNLTCTITDESGTVLAERSAASQGGSFGSASVMCSANRSN